MDLNSCNNKIKKALEELDILELTNINEEYIKKQYRKLALKWHPDKNSDKQSKDKFQKINESYIYLLNELPSLNIKNNN